MSRTCMMERNYLPIVQLNIGKYEFISHFILIFSFIFFICDIIEESNHHNDDCTVFQADIYATFHAAHILTEDRFVEKNIFF